MRVVLDCNVLVSAARIDGTCREVIDRAVRWHEVVLSEPILSEYEAFAGRRSQAPYQETMELVIREFERVAVFVEPANLIYGLRDPDDEVYLATAGRAFAIRVPATFRPIGRPTGGSPFHRRSCTDHDQCVVDRVDGAQVAVVLLPVHVGVKVPAVVLATSSFCRMVQVAANPT